MSRIKSFFKYLVGIDLIEKRRKRLQNTGERSLVTKIDELVEDICTFGIRYVPMPLVIDGTRRLLEVQYYNDALNTTGSLET